MRGIHFVTDEKGRRVAVQINLKKYGAIWNLIWDDLVSERRRKRMPHQRHGANPVKRTRKHS